MAGRLNKQRRAKPGSRLAFIKRAVVSDTNQCILWPFPDGKNRYGQLGVDGRKHKAHRLACEMAHGAPPAPGMHAAHYCAQHKCVNPKHLRWATAAENQQDKEKHGGQKYGGQHPNAKLSNAEVHYIRMRAARVPQKQLAAQFCVSTSHICGIQSGNERKHG